MTHAYLFGVLVAYAAFALGLYELITFVF